MELNDVYAGIFGGVVADALGVPYEFYSRTEMQENPVTTMTGHGTYNQPKGTWSDDSSLTLATLDSLTNGVDYDDMMNKFCQWYNEAKYTAGDEVFDCGITTSNALKNYYVHNKKPLKCGPNGIRDNGNGSLMRIMPACLYANAMNMPVKEQIKFISNTSSLTHGHAISFYCCNLYNFVVQEVLENKNNDFKTVLEKGIDNSRDYLEDNECDCLLRVYGNLFSLDDENIESKGYVEYSLETALYCCYHTESYEEAVLKAVNYGRDTDTNAMITGALAALYYGYESIPEDWLESIIRSDYIRELCNNFYNSL